MEESESEKPSNTVATATNRSLRALVASDLYRYAGRLGAKSFLKCFYFTPGFKFTFWFRVAGHCLRTPAAKIFYYPSRLLLNHYAVKFGIGIPCQTQIGDGFYIGHFGGIVVTNAAVLGSNINISQGVTIGKVERGKRPGAPVIGDNVYIGPGAKIIGAVTVGNYAAIGANAVVTKDVPKGAVVGGVPAVVISMDGSHGYINNVQAS